jgi:hypothetical protein
MSEKKDTKDAKFKEKREVDASRSIKATLLAVSVRQFSLSLIAEIEGRVRELKLLTSFE